MKLVPLTNGGFTKISDEDYEAVSMSRWYQSCGYARRTGDKLSLHRFVNNTPSGFDTDHINRDRLDNQRSNLATATKSENGLNRGKNRNNTSGYKGVVYMDGRAKPWVARLKYQGKVRYLGYHATPDEAGAAYEAGLAEVAA